MKMHIFGRSSPKDKPSVRQFIAVGLFHRTALDTVRRAIITDGRKPEEAWYRRDRRGAMFRAEVLVKFGGVA